MKDSIAVKRYAEAFMDFARETIGLEKAICEFRGLKNILRDNPEFQEVLHSLDIPYLEKCEFMDRILSPDFSNEFRQFLKLLLEKKRIDAIPDIIEYIRVAYAHLGKTNAILRTSFPLDLDLIKEIKEKLEHKFNKKFKFYIDLDGGLLGGVQVIIGNRIIDASVRSSLEDLKERLLAARV